MYLDSLIALRIMYLLVQPFKKWPAFKEGIIDDDGELLKDKKDVDSSNWTMLHRLVARIKRLLALAPGGKSLTASMVAAYALVREQYENNIEYDNLQEMYDMVYGQLTEGQMMEGTELLEQIAEEAGSSVGGGMVAGISPKDAAGNVDPVGPATIKNKYTDRNKKHTAMMRRGNQLSFKAYINGE